MSRRLILALACIATRAYAQDAPAPPSPDTPPPATDTPPTTSPPPVAVAPAPADTPAVAAAAAPADMSDQAIAAEVGAASGGRVSAGGLRIAGHYLYQLAAQDWFDGIAAFTFGGSGPACFRDRMDVYICDHGIADGDAFELVASVRHFMGSAAANKQFWPFIRGGIGIGFVRFGSDSVTGLSIPLHAGGGMRVSLTHSVALTAALDLVLGFGAFNHALGIEPQLGATLTVGAEFRL